MKFDFRIANAAHSNDASAQIRESFRMGMFAYCLRELGHDVAIASVSGGPINDERWNFFRNLNGGRGGDVLVMPAEKLSRSTRKAVQHRLIVGVKTSINCDRDAEMLESCDVVIAQENDPFYNGHANLLSVPFIIHDHQIEYFQFTGLLEAYLKDDLETIRGRFCQPHRRRAACFCGFQHAPDRTGRGSMLPSDLCEFNWVDTKVAMPAQKYLTWMGTFAAGIVFPGYTPKTNRWSEVAMLGLAIICTELTVPITPPATAANTIMLKSWADHETFVDGLNRAEEIVVKADQAYREGWSPMGQMKQLVRMLEAK